VRNTSTTETGAGVGRTWPTFLALVVVWALSLAGQIWAFSLLFVGWAMIDVVTGESFFIQRITRSDQPGAFWAVVISWLALAALWLVYPS
jgi:hypothetical protein